MKLFPENTSTYGGEIDNLFYISLVIVAIAFVISIVVLIYPMFKYREQKNRKATYITGTSWKHKKWIVAALILLGISDFYILFAEHSTWNKIEEQVPEPDVHVGITGRQWNWIFTYPGPDNKLNTGDDIVIDEQNSELHVPVNKNIVFDLRAKDVLHSFFVTTFRLKQDAVPGRAITRWFKATKTGKYDLSCAEICGVLHSKMRNYIVVESEEDYNKYLQTLYAKQTK